MVKKFLRLFWQYRELEKDLEREAALADSMERYIEALEGRDRERLARIEELEVKKQEDHWEMLGIISDLRGQLNKLRPRREEET
jgi:hypothetical protein